MKALPDSIPALSAAIGFITGIIAEQYVDQWWIVLVICTAIFVIAAIFKRYRFAFAVAFALLGWTVAFNRHPVPLPEQLSEKQTTYTAQIKRINENALRTVTADAVISAPCEGVICRLRLLDSGETLFPGDIIRFKAKLHRVLTTNLNEEFHENDYNRSTLLADGISATGYLSLEDCQKFRSGKPSYSFSEHARRYIHDLIVNSGVDTSTAWMMLAVVLGDDSGLDDTTVEQMRSVGVAHYLALSGFHVGVIVVVASMLLSVFKTWSRIGRRRHALVIAFVWVYAALCGMTPSLMRAAIFVSIALLAKIMQRRSSTLNSLCVAAIVSLAINPIWLFTPGFQLSFVAVAAIATMANPLNPLKSSNSRLLRNAGLFISVPLAATAATSLITAVHFHRIPLMFLPADIAIAFIMPMFIVVAVFVIAMSAIGLHMPLATDLLDSLSHGLNNLCTAISSLPCAEIRGIYPAKLTIIICGIAVVLFATALYRQKRTLAFAATALAIVGCIPTAVGARPANTAVKIGGDNRYSYIVATSGPHCIAISDDCISTPTYKAEEFNKRFAHYLDRRGTPSATIIAPDSLSLGDINRFGNYLTVGDKTFYLLFDDRNRFASPNIKVDYLYVGRGGLPYLKQTMAIIKPRKLLIAPNAQRQYKTMQADKFGHI